MQTVQWVADRGTGEPISLGAALRAGKKVAPDATELLMQDHMEAFGYFDWAEQATDTALRCEAVRKLCAALRAHMTVEEEILYPEAREATGEEDLVDHAYEEHAQALQLVEKLEAGLPKGKVAMATLKKLRQAIEHHVNEEHSKLFPALRASPADLYALGRQIAARRVELLFVLTGKAMAASNPKESNMAAISKDEAHDLFVTGLRDAHAAARQCKEMTERQVGRLENYPQVKARLEAHLGEKEAQLARLEQALDSLGESTSTLKDAAMAFMGNMTAMMTMPAGDEILKNGLIMSGMANFEIASIEALMALGEAAGQPQIIRALQPSLAEERAMAAWLAENLRGVVYMHLQLRSEGRQASH